MNYSELTKEISEQYGLKITSIKPYGNGHINTTFLLEVETTDLSKQFLVLQQINNEVFCDVDGLMQNICAITEHLKKKNVPTFEVLKTVDGQIYHTHVNSENGTPKYYRMISFVPNSFSYNFTQEPAIFAKTATLLGQFQKALADFPAEQLIYTIPEFHNTLMRYEAFEDAVAWCTNGRTNEADVIQLIDFIRARRDKYCSTIIDKLNKGKLPLRVTHNDTKLSNFLFSKQTGDSLCLIDLDTVMPGTFVHDFGDAIRFGASTALEDEADLTKVHFDIEKYNAFTGAYLAEMADVLTTEEKNCLPLAAINLTYENGIRFLTDYLNGDVYYKISHERHNLDRAKTQFKLVAEMEENFADTIKSIR